MSQKLNFLIEKNLYLLKLFEKEFENNPDLKNTIIFQEAENIKNTIPKKLVIINEKIKYINQYKTHFYNKILNKKMHEIYQNLEDEGYIEIDDSYKHLLNIPIRNLFKSDYVNHLEKEKEYLNNFLIYTSINEFKTMNKIKIFIDKLNNIFRLLKGERRYDNSLLSNSRRDLCETINLIDPIMENLEYKLAKSNELLEIEFQKYLNKLKIIDEFKIKLLIDLINNS